MFTHSMLFNIELTDIVEVHTLELCKIPVEADDNRLCYWMKFINAEGENELEAVAERDPLLKKAVVKLMELSADEKTRLLYEAREKERMDNEDRMEWARTSEREKWQVVIAEKDSCIAEKDSCIAEKDSRIAEKDSRIAEKDSRIAELEALLAMRDVKTVVLPPHQ